VATYKRLKVATYISTGVLGIPLIGWVLDILEAPRMKEFMANVTIGILQSVTSATIQQFIDQLFPTLT